MCDCYRLVAVVIRKKKNYAIGVSVSRVDMRLKSLDDYDDEEDD